MAPIGPIIADLDGMERLFRCKNRLSVFYCWMFSANSIVWSNIQLMVLNSKSTAVFAGDYYIRMKFQRPPASVCGVGELNGAILGRFDVTMLKPEVKYSRFRLPNRIYLYLSLYTRWPKSRPRNRSSRPVRSIHIHCRSTRSIDSTFHQSFEFLNRFNDCFETL